MDQKVRDAFFTFLLRLGDDRLVSGHRLSEWCGHAPALEEDIALANMGLDSIGQATSLLRLAGQIEGKGRDEDALAYFRNEREYRNCLLVELPRGDFGFTVLRQFFFAAYSHFLFEELRKSSNQDLAGISEKGKKESLYHVRHCSEWVIRLGDGTAESHARVQSSLNEMWPYTADLFYSDEIEKTLSAAGVIPALDGLRAKWDALIKETLSTATLQIPDAPALVAVSGRIGRHTEFLGHLLAEMQSVARAHPNARW
ncbi:MAG: phenylacetate-CoA oxygenase subunit PaaC [Deltaproteobacteria bacterium]|nr:phenylacetate-CoA oxygenase subunit PaaC [Deltaproteobacteria bacterium]